jgi:hypothetical protein
MNNEPEGMREIHAIQEKIYEKTKTMTIEEKMAYTRKSAEEVEKKYGFRLRKAVHVHK